jgi:lipase chaperone LimK
MSIITKAVQKWEDEFRDLFIERSGIQMDNGLDREKADQVAYLQVGRMRQERLNGQT